MTGRNSFVDWCIAAGCGQEQEDAPIVCGCCSVNVELEPGKEFEGEELLITSGEDEKRPIRDYCGKGSAVQYQTSFKGTFRVWHLVLLWADSDL